MRYLLLPVIIFISGYTRPAAAYLDPGAGSFILQMLLAGVMGLMLTLKLYWYRLKTYLRRLMGREVDTQNIKDGRDASTDDQQQSGN